MVSAQLETESTESGLDSTTVSPTSSEFDIFQNPVLGKNFFGFRVGNLGFLVPIDVFCEMLDKYQVNRLPNVPPWFNGLINLRGNLVPVFDIRQILNDIEQLPSVKKRRLFVIGRGEKAIALWIDSYPEILDITSMQPSDESMDLPPILQRVLTRGLILNEQVWLDCDLDRLFTALGRHHLATEETAI